MKIAVGSDPNAEDFKQQLIPFIKGLGHEVTDFEVQIPFMQMWRFR